MRIPHRAGRNALLFALLVTGSAIGPQLAAASDARNEGRAPASLGAVSTDDVVLALRVRDKIAADPTLAHRPIVVGAQADTVILSGEVETRAEMARAARIAATVTGAASVENHLTVAADG